MSGDGLSETEGPGMADQRCMDDPEVLCHFLMTRVMYRINGRTYDRDHLLWSPYWMHWGASLGLVICLLTICFDWSHGMIVFWGIMYSVLGHTIRRDNNLARDNQKCAAKYSHVYQQLREFYIFKDHPSPDVAMNQLKALSQEVSDIKKYHDDWPPLSDDARLYAYRHLPCYPFRCKCRHKGCVDADI